jgi:DNA polymerase V
VKLSLFDKLDRDKRKSINKAVDKLDATMGRDKVKLAVQRSDRKWKLKQEKLSPCYSTKLSDMLKVEIL